MKAVEVLGGRDNAAYRDRILPVRPEEVPVRPALRWLGPVWPGWVAAMATPWGVYVRADILAGDPGTLAKLISHELVHVRQWRCHGPVGFLWRYLADYARGRMRRLSHQDAYRAIALEVEARHIAGGA